MKLPSLKLGDDSKIPQPLIQVGSTRNRGSFSRFNKGVELLKYPQLDKAECNEEPKDVWAQEHDKDSITRTNKLNLHYSP